MKKSFALFLALIAFSAFGQTFKVQNLQVLGNATIATPLAITYGGTGASTQGAALTAILGSSTVPIANGGTGASTQPTALTAILGSSTVPIANGGTGASTQPAALTAILGSSTVPITNGGTGAATQPAALTAILGASVVPIANGGTNSATATGATTNLQYLQGATGSVARSLTNKFQDATSVLDFSGVDPTGAADSSTGIQAAITAVCVKGGTLYFPPGTYKISNQLANISCQGLYISGAGINNTVITSPNTTINLIPFTAPGHQGIHDITLTFTGTQTAGYAVGVTGTLNFTMDRVKITNAFQGVFISGGAIQYFTDIEIRNTVPTTGVGIYITGFGNDQFLKNIVMDSPNATQPLAGIRINNTNAVWIDSVDIVHQGYGLLVDPQTAADFITWLFVSNSAFDSGASSGISLAPANAAALIKGSTFVNDWTATNGAAGVSLSGSGIIDGVRFVGHRSFNNQQSGYQINGASTGVTNIEFNDSDAAGNSLNSPGTFSGFDIGAGISGFSITNSRSGQQAQFANTQSRGIIVNPGASDNYVISGNDLRGNLSAGIFDGGSGTNKQIFGNIPFSSVDTLSAGALAATGTVSGGAGQFTEPTNGVQTLRVINTGSNGANIQLQGNGGTTPNKTLRAKDGSLQMCNSAYGACPVTISDTGSITTTGNLSGVVLTASGAISHAAQEVDASYTFNTPTTGQTVTLATGTETALIVPAGTLATLTITLPGCTAGYDGSLARFSSSQAITVLTVNATSGTVVDAPNSLGLGGGNGYLCRGANTSWYRLY